MADIYQVNHSLTFPHQVSLNMAQSFGIKRGSSSVEEKIIPGNLSTPELEKLLKEFSDEYVAGLVQNPGEEGTSGGHREGIFEQLNQLGIDPGRVNEDKYQRESEKILEDRYATSKTKGRFYPFASRKEFIAYVDAQCKVVNKSYQMRAYPDPGNPWLVLVVLVHSTSYLAGVPIVGILSLPIGFPTKPPNFIHFVNIGTRYNVNYYLKSSWSQFDRSSACSSMEFDWREEKLCSSCELCKSSHRHSCMTCSEEECKEISKVSHISEYYPTIESALMALMYFYVEPYVPQMGWGSRGRVPEEGYIFEAETSKTIHRTILELWGVYYQLQGLFGDSTPFHLPPNERKVYAKFVDSTSLRMNSKEGVLESTPVVKIPDKVKVLGIKKKNNTNVNIFSSESTRLDDLKGDGRSVVLIPEKGFANSGAVVSFIVSNRTGSGFLPKGGGLQSILRAGLFGYGMVKKPHEKEVWFNHGSILKDPHAIWLTLANDQFVVAVQETETSIPHLLGGVPVGKLSSVFTPQDSIYLHILIKSGTSTKKVRFEEFHIAKGAVHAWEASPMEKSIPLCYVALFVNDENPLIKALDGKGPFVIHADEIHNTSTSQFHHKAWNMHCILGHCNDGREFYEMRERWGYCIKEHSPEFEVKISTIYYNSKAIVAGVESINSVCGKYPMRDDLSLRSDFHHIVVGLANDEKPCYARGIMDSPDCETLKLECPVVLSVKSQTKYPYR